MTKNKFFDYQMHGFHNCPACKIVHEIDVKWTREFQEDLREGFGLDTLNEMFVSMLEQFRVAEEEAWEGRGPAYFNPENVSFCEV